MLMRPFLNKRAKILVSRMDTEITENYDDLKRAILRELRLTAKGYLEKFQTSTRKEYETFLVWSNRLDATLSAYLESRQVAEFNDLKSLLVTDRMKQATEGTAVSRQIQAIEAQLGEGKWLKHRDLALAMDSYVANRPTPKEKEKEKTRESFSGNGRSRFSKWRAGRSMSRNRSLSRSDFDSKKPEELSDVERSGVASGEQKGQRKGCYRCGKSSCRSYYHDKDGSIKPEYKHKVKSVSRVQVERSSTKRVRFSKKIKVINDCQISSKGDAEISQLMKAKKAEEFEILTEPLEYVNVIIKDNKHSEGHNLKALKDSGAELTLLKKSVLVKQKMICEPRGTVRIRGVVGKPIEANLSWVHMSLPAVTRSIPVLCAVSDEFHDNFVLPTTVLTRLIDAENEELVRQGNISETSSSDSEFSDDENIQSVSRVQTRSMTRHVDQSNSATSNADLVDDSSDNDNDIDASDKPDDSEIDVGRANADELRKEQRDDATLGEWRHLANQRRGKLYYYNGLLYKRDKIAGRPVQQLVLPVTRRKEAFRLAHSTCHLGVEKVYQRMRLSFVWPCMKKDLKLWSDRCDVCQRHKRVTYLDRTPITPIPRADEPFSVMFYDCFGPILPDTAAPKPRYNYGIVIIDSSTRYPWCEPLPNLSAKSVCSALISVFSMASVPRELISDNGSNFTSKLTKEFLARLGCSPKFCLPYHARSVGLSERLVQSMKSMIGKLAAENPRSWHHQIKFALWALRETVNSTTGVSPYQLLTSYPMRGPCAILADSWSGDQPLPLNIGKSVVDYLMDLRANIERGLDFAQEHAERAQQAYAEYFNRKSRDKYFEEGDEVLILTPDTTKTKTFARWQGPARVTEVLSPHGYIVELNGVRQRIHADRIRRYLREVDEVTTPDTELSTNVSSSTCAVVYENDSDFGDIHVVETDMKGDKTELPSSKIAAETVSHLSPQQRDELFALLDKYAVCFRDTPGFTDKAVHNIVVTDDFKPRRLPQYKIPHRLRAEVDRQIREMLDLGIIEESDSPMASPVVCVLKGKDGKDGVRVVVDLRYVNRYTVRDQFPVEDINDLLQEVGNSRYLSTFDAKSGYHQTPVNPEHRWLTAFICNGSLYQYARTPFGAKNSGGTFCRAVSEILKPVREFTKSYVDDMIVHSDEWTDHLRHVEKFLQAISDSGMTLSLKKCEFGKSQVKWCGQLVGSGIRLPDHTKVACIQALMAPKTKRDLRRILGMFAYFSEYIENYAEKALPLTRLTGKTTPDKIPWGETEQRALDELKVALIKATQQPLHIIDWNKAFEIHCDASDHSISGYLGQQTDTGERPIAFFSSKLSPAQRKWAIIEKEAYAAIYACKKFRSFIFMCPEINLHSDHNPLLYLTESAPKSARLMRWALALQEYPIKWHYKRGQDNIVSDFLSRYTKDEGVC